MGWLHGCTHFRHSPSQSFGRCEAGAGAGAGRALERRGPRPPVRGATFIACKKKRTPNFWTLIQQRFRECSLEMSGVFFSVRLGKILNITILKIFDFYKKPENFRGQILAVLLVFGNDVP